MHGKVLGGIFWQHRGLLPALQHPFCASFVGFGVEGLGLLAPLVHGKVLGIMFW